MVLLGQLFHKEELEKVLAFLVFVGELQQTEENIGVLESGGQDFITLSITNKMTYPHLALHLQKI